VLGGEELSGGWLTGNAVQLHWRRTSALLVAATFALIGAAGFAESAAALTPTITAYPTDLPSSAPYAIAAGSDGALWFTELNSREVGRMTVGGTLTLHAALPGGSSASYPYGIAAGSDGAMWFVAQAPSIVGRIDGSGTIQTKALASATANPTHIVSGPDGALWFTEGVTKALGRIPAATPLQTPDESRTTTEGPDGIASGSDGNLWFTEYTAQMIGRMTPGGVTKYFPVTPPTANPQDITAGPEGALWYTEINPEAIVRTAADGTQRAIPLPTGVFPWAIATGSDGALWVAGGEAIARVTTDGSVQTFPVPPGAGATSIAAGPDGNVWFNEENFGKIGRITTPPSASTTAAIATGSSSAAVIGTANGHAQATSFHVEYGPIGGGTSVATEHALGVTTGDTPASATLIGLAPSTAYRARLVVTNPTGATAGTWLSFTTAPAPPAAGGAPALSGLKLAPSAFFAAPSGPTLSRVHYGTTASYRDSQAANTTFTVLQKLRGVLRGRKCVAPRRAHPKQRLKRCTRRVAVGSFTRLDIAGVNRFRFSGRLNGRALKRGRYALRAAARAGTLASRPIEVGFRIKNKRRH
jgi:virginiamycin B lyase